MSSSLRGRIALIALLGAFLIPIGMSNLRGLTHVLTCSEEVAQPFTLVVPPNGRPQVLSSTLITSEKEPALCGGLRLEMAVRAKGPGEVAMILPITNDSEFAWRGTVKLVIGGTSIPADIGEIEAGTTETDTLDVKLDPGTHEVEATLLIGP